MTTCQLVSCLRLTKLIPLVSTRVHPGGSTHPEATRAAHSFVRRHDEAQRIPLSKGVCAIIVRSLEPRVT
jgi:hypothetical protein